MMNRVIKEGVATPPRVVNDLIRDNQISEGQRRVDTANRINRVDLANAKVSHRLDQRAVVNAVRR